MLHTSLHAQDPEFSSEQLEFFERKVRPVLVDNCYSCHSVAAQKNEGSLLLDSRAAILEGGDSGEAVVPGDPDASLLISAIKYKDYEMPPKGQLPKDEIEVLKKWVEMGAPWPAEDKNDGGLTIEEFDLQKRRKEHWVWQPIVNHEHPIVDSTRWSKTSIDKFVYAKLAAKNLEPAEQAKPLAIARRLHIDLIGLPATADELNQFRTELANGKQQAIENLVDRLLASPHFGERWGRHWLDITRYAESRGHEFDIDIPNAFQYRDYVIRALNADVPYDQFVREHIAGDLLDEPRLHPENEFNESVLGTGFWFLGEATHSPVDILKDESERFDNMIDAASKSFLGVTVSCARCHDHKFDAISTADFYSLTGFLHSSDYRQVRFESLEQNRKISKELSQTDREYQTEILKLLADEGVQPPAPADPLNDKHVVFDFANLPQTQFLQDGFVFGQQPQQAGNIFLNVDGEATEFEVSTFGAAVNDPFWNGLESITQGVVSDRNKLTKIPRNGRALRTPTFELEQGDVSCLVSGSGTIIACVDSHRVIAGPLHKETIVKFGGDSNQKWVSLKLARYIGHRLHLEFVPDERQQIKVRLVTQGLKPGGQTKLMRRLSRFDKAHIEYADKANQLLQPSVPVDQKEGNHAVAQPTEIQKVLQRWRVARTDLQSKLVLRSHLAPAMGDGSGEDGNIYIRGNSSKPGDIEPRHFLTAIAGDQPMKIERGSGRLELADAINAPDNPLTSRVISNRIWHYLMGRGLVSSTDDFGVLGQRPTHPELLDHLATEFRADGQSIKRMIKRIVMTEAYQMASRPNLDSQKADPKNLLWHHRPPKRMEGEAIRDSLLTLSGTLDRTLEGPSIPVHLTKFMEGRGRPKVSGPLDGDGRRSIYVSVRRNFLSPFMVTFDTPNPSGTMGRRNVSNVPAQALILMNNPFIAEQAKKWAARSLKASDSSEQRIELMYESAFGRKPTDRELGVAMKFVGPRDDIETWAQFAHALINTKEFIFLP